MSILRFILPLVGILAVGPASAGDLTPRSQDADERLQPAMWSLGSRLEKRFDPQLRAERVKRAQAGGRLGTTRVSGGEATLADVIIGSEDPELFLPHELFDVLLDGAFLRSASRTHSRSLVEENYGKAFPLDFWNRLEIASKAYLADRAALYEAQEKLQEKLADPTTREKTARELDAMQADDCAKRIAALEAANAELGPALLEILYDVIAPSIVMSVSSSENESDLRRVAGGCR